LSPFAGANKHNPSLSRRQSALKIFPGLPLRFINKISRSPLTSKAGRLRRRTLLKRAKRRGRFSRSPHAVKTGPGNSTGDVFKNQGKSACSDRPGRAAFAVPAKQCRQSATPFRADAIRRCSGSLLSPVLNAFTRLRLVSLG
jgi:hypothetical protein